MSMTTQGLLQDLGGWRECVEGMLLLESFNLCIACFYVETWSFDELNNRDVKIRADVVSNLVLYHPALSVIGKYS